MLGFYMNRKTLASLFLYVQYVDNCLLLAGTVQNPTLLLKFIFIPAHPHISGSENGYLPP